MCACEVSAPRDGGPAGISAQEAQEACRAFLDRCGNGADLGSLPDSLLQRLLALAVRAYAARLEAGEPCEPFTPEGGPTASEVCPVVAHMLRAADVELFELAMWQHLVAG